jgi:hypothetical protein
MTIIESDDVVNQTTKCKMDFACLSGRFDHLCEVEQAIGSRPVLFLSQGEQPLCHYNYRFGDGQMCSCPVRLELYRHYGI